MRTERKSPAKALRMAAITSLIFAEARTWASEITFNM
jgi:hypothetical protein